MASYKPYDHHQPQQSFYCIRLRKIPSLQLANHIKMDVEYLAPPEELYSIILMPSKFEDNTYVMYINFYLQKTSRECGEYIISKQYSNEIILNEQKYTPAHQQETKIELLSPLDIYFSKFEHSIADTIGECYELTRNTIVLNRKLSTAETSQKKKDLVALLRTIIWAPTRVTKDLLPSAEKYVKINAQHTCIIFKQEKEECFNLKYSDIFSIICLCGRESEVKVLQSALNTPLYHNLKLTQRAYEVITASKPRNSNILEIESKRCNVLCIKNQPNLELLGYTQEDIDAFVQGIEQITYQIQILLGNFIDKTKIKFCCKCLLQNFSPVCDILSSIEEEYQITLSPTQSNDIAVGGDMEALMGVEMEYISIQNNICTNIISKLSSFKTSPEVCFEAVLDLSINFIEYHMNQEEIFIYYRWEYDRCQNETKFQMEFIGLAGHVNSLAAKFETIQPMTDKLPMNRGDIQHFNAQRAAFSDIESEEFVKFYPSPDGRLIYYCSLSVSSKTPLELFDGAMYQQEGDRKISLFQTLVFYLTKKNLLNSCERQFNCKIVCLQKENTNEAHSRGNRQTLLIKGKIGDIFKAIEHLKQLEKSFTIIPVHFNIELKFLSFYKKELEAFQGIFRQREKILLDIRDARNRRNDRDHENIARTRNRDTMVIKVFSIDKPAGEETAKELQNALTLSYSESHDISENQAKKIGQAIKDGSLGKDRHYYVNLTTSREGNCKHCSVVLFAFTYFKDELEKGLEDLQPYLSCVKEIYSFPLIFAEILFYSKEYKECVKSKADFLGIEYQLPKTWSDKFTFTGDILNIRSLKSEMKKFELKFLQKCDQLSIEVNMPFDKLQRDAKYKQIENDLLRYDLIKIYLEHEFPDNIEEEIISLSLEMSEINPNFYCPLPSFTNTSTDIQYNQVLGSFSNNQDTSQNTTFPIFSWQENDGKFYRYNDAIMKILQEACNLNANVPVTIRIGDYKYLIDFKTKQQKNLLTNRVRNINIASQDNLSNNLFVHATIKNVDFNTFGYTWYFFDDQNTWAPYSQELCDKLNEIYLNDQNGSVNVTQNKYQYEINFAKMTQKNCETNKVRKIQVNRDGLDVKIDAWSTATSQNLILYGPRDKLQASKKKLIHLIAESTTTENIAMQDIPKSMMFSTIDELKKKFSYIKFSTIDAAATDPTPKNCLYTIKIDGFNDEVNRAQTIIYEKRIKFLQNAAQNDSTKSLPSTWDPMPPSTIIHLVNLTLHSSEWKDVARKFNATATNQIRLIQRIQNVWLWDKYQFAKKQLEEKHRGSNIGVNELKVFHGTRNNDPDLVYSGEEGFDMRYSKKGFWGMANYFAVNASFSVKYSYTTSSKLKQMLLVRILAGDVITMSPDSSLRMPPSKNADGKFLGQRYDTVTGDATGSKVYMLYTNERAYPEYLITFL